MMHRLRKPLCWTLIVALVWLLPPVAGVAGMGMPDAVGDVSLHAAHHAQHGADPADAMPDHACCDEAMQVDAPCPCGGESCAGCALSCHLNVSLPGVFPGIDARPSGERITSRPVFSSDFRPAILLEPPRS